MILRGLKATQDENVNWLRPWNKPAPQSPLKPKLIHVFAFFEHTFGCR